MHQEVRARYRRRRSSIIGLHHQRPGTPCTPVIMRLHFDSHRIVSSIVDASAIWDSWDEVRRNGMSQLRNQKFKGNPWTVGPVTTKNSGDIYSVSALWMSHGHQHISAGISFFCFSLKFCVRVEHWLVYIMKKDCYSYRKGKKACQFLGIRFQSWRAFPWYTGTYNKIMVSIVLFLIPHPGK